MGKFLKSGSVGPGYTNWCAVAAFFDGDGGLDVEARAFTLHWSLSFVDNWPPQLLQIRTFLRRHGIEVSLPRRSGHGGWKIQVSSIESLKRIGRQMLRSGCLVKKKDEIEMMIQYFDEKVTGTKVGKFFNNEVAIGKRTGKIRKFDVPFTYLQGKSASRNGLTHGRSSLSRAQKDAVSKSYSTIGLTMYQLATMYHVSPSTIYRIIHGMHRGRAHHDQSRGTIAGLQATSS